MATKRGKGNKVQVDGVLNMEVVLSNIKEAEGLIDRLNKKVDAAAKTASLTGEKGTTVQNEKGYAVNAVKENLAAGKALIANSQKVIEGFKTSGQDLSKLSKRENAKLQRAFGGVYQGMSKLQKSAELAGTVLADAGGKRAPKELADAINDSTALQKRYTQYLNEVNPEMAKLAKARAEERASIQRANKERNVQTAIAKQRGKEEAAQSALGRRFQGTVTAGQFQSLDPTGRKQVGEALKGRATVLQQQLGAADRLGLGEGAKDILTGQLKRANAEIQKFNNLTSEAAKLKQEDAAFDKAKSLRLQEQAKQNKISAAFAKREAEQAKQKEADFAKFEADLKKQQAAEQKALAAQEANRKKYAAKAKATQEKELAERRALRNKELADSQKARDRELAQSLAAAKRRRRAELAEAKKLAAEKERIAKRAAALEKSNQDKARAERANVAQKKAVAQDVFAKTGATGFRDIDYNTISRENIGALQAYAKAEQNAAKAILLRAQAQGKSQKTVAAFSENLRQQTEVVRRLENRFRQLNSPLQQVNLLFRQFFRFAIGYGALYQLLGGIRALTTGVIDLNTAMYNIQAITASTDKEMAGLERTIKRVATTTKFTTNEIAQATQVLGQAGVSSEELPSALQATADFAAATASDLAIAADLVTTYRNVFKDLSDGTIADQLTKAVNISKLTGQDLKTILSLSAQTAESFNLTSEQYLGAVTTLRNAGIKASTVATGLRQGLLEIFTPDTSSVKALKDRYRQLGETLTEEAIKQRFFGFTKADNPLIAVLSELKRIGFADDAQKEFSRAFDVRAANAIKALINNFDELAEAESRITFGVAAADAADIQMKSLSNSAKNLGAAMTVLGDQILGGAVESLETFTDKATEAIKVLTDLDIELKSQGKEGLGAALGPAVFGAIAGGTAGKTIKGKILGTLAGGVAGGAAGIGGAGSGAEGIGTAGIAGLLGITGLLGGNALYGAGKAAKNSYLDFKTAPKGAANIGAGIGGGRIAGLLAKSAIGRGALAFIPVIGPVVSAIATVLSLVFAFSDLLTDARSPAEQAASKAEAALAKLDATEAELEKAQQFADEFDVNAAERGDIAGKTANSVANLTQGFKEVRESIAEVFGNLDKGTQEALDDLLLQYSKGDLSTRKALAPQIRGLTGAIISDSDFDRIVYQIGTDLRDINDASEAFADEFGILFRRAQETIEEAVQQNRDINDADFANARAVLEVFQSSDDFKAVIRGDIENLSKGSVEVFRELSSKLSAVNDEQIKALTKLKTEQSEESIRAQVRSAIESSNASNLLSIQSLIDSISSSGQLVGEEAKIHLQTVEKILREEIDRLEADFVTYRLDLSDGLGVNAGARRRGRRQGIPQKRAAAQASANALPALKQGLEDNTAEQEALRQRNIEAISQQLEKDRAVLETAYSQLGTASGQTEARRSIEGVGGELADTVNRILEAPQNATAIITETYGKYLNQGSYEIGEEGKAKYANDAKEFATLVEFLTNLSTNINNTLQGEAEYQRIVDQLPAVSDLTLIDELDREISKLTSRKAPDKEGRNALIDLNNPNNIFNQRREAQKRVQLAVIEGIQDDIDILAGAGKEKIGTLDKKGIQRYLDLQVSLAKANADLIDIDETTVQEHKKLIEEIEKDRIAKATQLANLNKEVAQKWIELAGAASDEELFVAALNKIDENNAELLKELENQLRIEGFEKGTELYDAELKARAFLLRDIQENSEEFGKALRTFTSGLREQADLLRNNPITLGATQDAFSERQGTIGDARRAQGAAFDLAGVAKLLEANRTELGFEQQAQAVQSPDEAAKTQLRIDALNQSMVELQQESVALTLAMMESSASTSDRANAELAMILNTQLLVEGLQDSEYAFKNLAERINNTFLQAVEGIGDAISKAVLDGDSFKELIGNLFNDIGRQLVTTGIQTIVNELATTGLQALQSAGFGSLIGGAGEAAQTAVGDAAEAATTGSAVGLAVTTALVPATLGLQAANTQMFLAGTQLTIAAGALTTAAATMAAGGAAEAGGGILADFAGAALTASKGGMLSGGKIKGYAKGGTPGIISGPGTGKSDSILAAYLNNEKVTPIRVANGESILTAKATDALGEGFINFINKKGKIPQFKSGAMMGRQNGLATGTKAPASAQPSSITNQNDTTIVNAIDSSSIVAAALETPAGSKAIINYMRANKSKMQRILQ